jgi:ankyrin repeat protein
MRLLLERGANANATNGNGATPLMFAAGDAAKVKLLLAHGAEVNVRSRLGNTPLMTAARPYGGSEAVELLLHYGADVNATNVFGASPLMMAAASGDLKTARLLLGKGADVNAPIRGGIDNAIWGGGRSALMWAAARNDLAMMKLLLKAGARVNEQEAFGTALTQAAWMDRHAAAELLLKRGAEVNAKEFMSGFTALHWAASSDNSSPALVNLLLKHGANPNAPGGEPVDAYLGIEQTPWMLAKLRGDTAIFRALEKAGARPVALKEKSEPALNADYLSGFDTAWLKLAIDRSLPALQRSSVSSKKAFVSHASKQDCVSCHQQYMPMTALALAKTAGAAASLDQTAEQALLEMVRRDNTNLYHITAETTFHPEPAHGYGYALLGMAAQAEPPSAATDAMVHHLLNIQGKDGQWFNNLPRPPLQTSDVGATALAAHALAAYGPPARSREIHARLARARAWLRQVKPENTEEQAYQIMGLVWAGEPAAKTRKLAATLERGQRPNGGWAQLPGLESDAYATGQALYALHLVGIRKDQTTMRNGLRYLVASQRPDGTWFAARRAFPFQPTMNSGYPHGRDSWISATAASWAVMALSAALEPEPVQISAKN